MNNIKNFVINIYLMLTYFNYFIIKNYKYILNYKAGDDFGIDDIEIETDFEGEES